MKVKLIYSILLAAVVFSASTQAQDGPNVVRSRLCNVNPGYSMSEVVEFARNIEWPEEYTPSAMFFREARAVPGDFQRDWDFVWSSFFLDWEDQYQTISAQNNRPGGRTGNPRLRDMISCDERVSIANVNQANQAEIFSDTDSTPMGSQFCDLNGATVQDAITMATAVGQRLGAYSAVDVQAFGGQGGYEAFSRVYVRYVFANGQTFADSLDALRGSPPPAAAPNGIRCGSGALWLSHRIYQEN